MIGQITTWRWEWNVEYHGEWFHGKTRTEAVTKAIRGEREPECRPWDS